MNKRKIRDSIKLAGSLLFCWLYIPHFMISLFRRGQVRSDVLAIQDQINVKLPFGLQLLYLLHNNRYFRTVFYHRIGPALALLISWVRPGDRYFTISATTKLGEGIRIAHPYATVLNAESIGNNFSCIHCTTIGAKDGCRPIIGNNVSLGCNVIIIGNVKVGNDVIVGAGSVVVKDVPDRCVVAGNPAKVIRYR